MQVVIPVRSFGDGKTRLGSLLDIDARQRLSRAMTQRTVELALDNSDHVMVVTADAEVAGLAHSVGARTYPDAGGGLSRAVTSAVSTVTGPWSVLHADLPLLTASELTMVDQFAADGLLVPSPDGGTPVIAGSSPDFRFSYGPGSFHRHLLLLPHARILTNIGLALDIDGPSDLQAALAHPRGTWLRDVVGTPNAEGNYIGSTLGG